MENALAAIAAARHAGVAVPQAIEALGISRASRGACSCAVRSRGVRVYDDFAHHPTAIATTLDGLRGASARRASIAVLEPRSNTMRMGVHQRHARPLARRRG